MRIFVAFLAAFCFSASASDSMVAHGPSDETVRISHDACTDEAVIAQIERVAARYRKLFYEASATVDGKLFHACWLADGEYVHVLYEDGDHGMIPMSDFKPDGV